MRNRELLNRFLFLPLLNQLQSKEQHGGKSIDSAKRGKVGKLLTLLYRKLSLRYPAQRVRLILLSRRVLIRLLCLGIQKH